MKTIGIIGSRRRNTIGDYLLVEAAFNKIYEPGDRIVSGGCKKGGDKFAEIIAKKKNITPIIHPAEWKKNGYFNRAAGFERNTFIAMDSDVLIACVSDDRTGGTEDTIKKFQKLGKAELILI